VTRYDALAILALISAVPLFGCAGPTPESSPATDDTTATAAPDLDTHANALAHELIIVDTHVDLPYRLHGELEDLTVATEGHFDLPRALDGGLDAPFMSIYIPAEEQESGGAKELADKLISLVESIAAEWPDRFTLAVSPAEVRVAHEAGLIALPMGMENGAPIETIDDVSHYFDRGIRYVTLTHSENNQICDSSYATEETWNGLSDFGREVVAEMNRVGMMIDISHVSDETFFQVVEITEAPLIASHSSCRHFTPGFERNMSDEMIEALAENGGVMQINFGSAFITEEANTQAMAAWASVTEYLEANGLTWSDDEADTKMAEYYEEHGRIPTALSDVADHIDHVVELVGIDHVGIGSDYDGVYDLPVGLEDVSTYPALLAELLRRGYSDEDLGKLCGENLLRVWREVEATARSLARS